MDRHLITLYALEPERAGEVLPEVARGLGEAVIALPDSAAMVEVEVVAASREAALARVADAIAAASADEALTFTETTGTGYDAPGHRAPDPDEEPREPEPPHLERGSPREDGPGPDPGSEPSAP